LKVSRAAIDRVEDLRDPPLLAYWRDKDRKPEKVINANVQQAMIPHTLSCNPQDIII
jgi:hypothetical protein